MKKNRNFSSKKYKTLDEKLDYNKYDLKYFRSLQNILSAAGPAASASYTLTGSILIFLFVGWYFDNENNTSPVGLITGILLGLFIGFYHLFKTIKQKK
tara:strand:- start:1244 stop:1537 length:294 start_codon:yes stop_codon:yes gene_type:complete